MRGYFIGERLDQPVRATSDEAPQFSTDSGIINGPREVVAEIAKVVARLQRERNRQPLRLRPFLFGHADASPEFQLLDSNLIARRNAFKESLELAQVAH